MKSIATFLLLLIVFGNSCSSSIKHIFENRTPHEKYADKLDAKGLDDTPEGRAWLAASKKALEAPQSISLPYRQNGYFGADKPRALGLLFNVKRGERITFNLTKKGNTNLPLYADVFQQNGSSLPILSADTATTQFSFDADETGSYILRLQPELFRSGEYSLSASVGPSLGFPVSYSKANVGSVWGDNRDGGKRRHEGIDIFAPKLSPAIAAEDGYITGVREGGIGGKTVWLKPNNKSVFLYYAHLDKQLVQEGQFVKKGDVVGLVGNTGNAQYTSSHLHFGVYTFAGPVDPLPFVNRAVKTAPTVPDKNLTGSLKLTKTQKTAEGVLIKANTVLVPLAVTVKGYIAELPDGNFIQAPFASVQVIKQPAKPVNALATTPAGETKKS
ncbi:MAG: M23 family metallopeptidase [Flavisolibacter sp.]|nr:M23 family metallopeptidase [Flavisolibacter sp.]